MKKVSYFIISSLFFFMLIPSIHAGASLTTNYSTVTKGSSFTTTVSLSGVAAWEVHVSARGPVSNCTINAADSSEDASNTSKKYSATCKTTGTGTIKITLSGNVTTASGSTSNISASKTVTVKEKSTTTSSSSSNSTNKKSSNNDLTSLSIEGYEISPTFNKNITNYTVTVPYGTEKIQINAYKEDNKASISGDYIKEVKEGENKFDVTVTAENGDKKVYTINVMVDSKPIEVLVDEKKYTLVKKATDLKDISLEHEIIKLTIEDQEVEAYRVDSINYILVGLRDSDGKISLFKFDSYKDDNIPFKYTLYQEISSNTITLIPTDTSSISIPSGYKKEEIEINGEKVTAYQKDDGYYLIYGMNIETGKESFYSYDKEEGTFQRYIEVEEQLSLDTLKLVFIGAASVVSIFVAIIIVLINKLRKNK